MKKGKKALIVVLCVVAGIGVAVGGIVGFAQGAVDKAAPDAFLSDWMDGIKDTVLLRQTVIPGSHDTGTYGMNWMAETQDKDVAGQLSCGARYFDVRVTEKKGELVTFHGPIKGKKAIPMLETLAAFVQGHPTETLIVDFQHFEENAEARVLAYVQEAWDGILLRNETEKDDLTFIDDLTVGQCRGKILAFVSNATYAEETCFFLRSGNEGNEEGTSLQSYYDASLNEGSPATYVKDALPQYIASYKAYGKGLFVLQGQLTDKLRIFGPKFREAQNTKRMGEYVVGLNASDDLTYINVVMRDYLSAEKCAKIIMLNAAKYNVKADSIVRFVTL